MSSNYIMEEDDPELLYLKWFPRINCCKTLNLRTTSLVLSYIQCLLYAMVTFLNLFIEPMIYYYMHSFSYLGGLFTSFGECASFVMSVVLLIGIHKEKKSYIYAWLLVREIWILEMILTLILNFPFLYFVGFEEAIFTVVMTVLSFILMLYIHDYYLFLSEKFVPEPSRPLAANMES